MSSTPNSHCRIGAAPAAGGADTKQTSPKWPCYFSFKEPARVLFMWGERLDLNLQGYKPQNQRPSQDGGGKRQADM